LNPGKTALFEESPASAARKTAGHDLEAERTDLPGASVDLGEEQVPIGPSDGLAVGTQHRPGESGQSATTGRCSKSSLLRKLGFAGFLFFTLKGMLWLVAGYAAVKANGCASWGS